MGEEGEEWEINTASARMAERVEEGDGKKIDCLKLKAGKKPTAVHSLGFQALHTVQTVGWEASWYTVL